MPDAYIFDLDGTLADSYRALAASLNYVRAAAGLAPLSVAEVRRLVGEGRRRLLAKGAPGMPVEDAIALFADHHPSVVTQETKLLPGARTVLRTLSRRGRKIALASNKPGEYCTTILRHFGLDGIVRQVWDPQRAGAPKPDPAMLLAAVHSLDASPGDAVYVGDMVIDVDVARRAGLPVWTVATGGSTIGELRDARPDRLLRRLSEILDLDEGGQTAVGA